jgi:excisionase family DNA binding protein
MQVFDVCSFSYAKDLTLCQKRLIMRAKSGVHCMSTQWLTVEDIAKELNVSIETVRNWIRKNRLIAYRVGRDYRIKRIDYEKFLEERKTGSQDDE